MKHYKSLVFAASALMILTSCGASSEENVITAKNIEIVVGNQTTNVLNAEIGKTYQLKYKITPEEAKSEVVWSIDNTNVANIDQNGNLTTTANGEAVVTVKIKEKPSIFANLYLTVKSENEIEDPVGLKKVGTGFTKDDPIFGGNEGKDAPLEIYFIEVRQMYGDAIYIKKGHFDMLIDAGEEFDGTYINKFLKEKMEDSVLDVVMASHGDADHIDGFTNALKDVEKVSTFIDYGGVQSTPYSQRRDEYIAKGSTYHTAYDCVNFTDGITDIYYLTDEVTLEILDTGNYSKNTEDEASNPHSVACLFTYRDFKFFTAGDLTTSSEADLLKKEKNLKDVTLYKASHHGSKGSNSQELLNKLNPKGVAISAARSTTRFGVAPSEKPTKNDTNLDLTGGHPHKEALERIYKIPNIMASLDVHWNAVNGTMCYSTTGTNSYTFRGSKLLKGYYDLSLTNGEGVWDESIQDFKNKVTGEENKKLHETVVFKAREWTDLVEGLL